MKKILVASLLFSLFLGGCQINNEQDNSTDHENSTEEVADSDKQEDTKKDENDDVDTTDYDNIKLSPEEAFDIFMDKYPNAKINEIELDFEGNTYKYEIEGYEGNTEYEIKIDAFSKDVYDEEKEHETDEHGELKRDQLSKINDLVKEALDDAGSEYYVDEWELKVKSDYIKFEIELQTEDGKEIEYKYDFESGELLEKDVD